MNIQVETVTINGVEYVRADAVQAKPIVGNRHVVVVDRGWIFAGDLESVDGRLKLTLDLMQRYSKYVQAAEEL